MRLSVSLISHNEEKNLPRTLDSIKEITDEIIIVDSESTDSTKSVAESYGAKFFVEKWKGFANQKNSSLEKCSGDWILCLDCDEVVSTELLESIKNIMNNDSSIRGFEINRKTFYIDKLLNYAWQPDKKLRFVKKSSQPKWVGGDVHESLEVNGQTETLKGYLIHYSYKDMTQHFNKTIDYALLSAKAYNLKGKKFKFSNLILNPIIAFIRLYFINKGILDGVYGFIAAMSSMIGTFLKYAFLWEIERKK